MTPVPIETLIQRQIHQWNRFRDLLAAAERPEEIPPRPLVTISRERGAGGRQLAAALATRLDLQVHDRTVVEKIASDENLEQSMVEHLDRQVRSQLKTWFEGALKQRIFLRDNYHVALVRTVKTLAAHGGVVFLGRGANVILAEQASLRLLLVAPVEERLRRLRESKDLDEREARRTLEAADEQRREFLSKLFHVEANDPHHHDLALDTGRLPVDRAVEIVMSALEVRGAFTA